MVGAKNSVLKLMAAALLAPGRTTLTNCPEILDVPLMAEVLRAARLHGEIEGGHGRRSTRPEELNHRARYESVRQAARVRVRARAAGGPLQEGGRGPARR